MYNKIYVAGHRGMVGSAIIRKLQNNYITSTFDLRDQLKVNNFLFENKPDCVILAAAKVGGIQANNSFKAEFIYDNLTIASNIIHASYLAGVKRLIFLGSSCIYPKNCPQPIKEEYLLTSPLEATNEPYAIAKISGLKICQFYNEQYGTSYLSLMPTNLYGPNDNYDLNNSHVLPALIRKIHVANQNNVSVTLWGSGKPRREFLHVDDLAEACLFLLDKDVTGIINIGTGQDISICNLAALISKVIGYGGQIKFDGISPDGTYQKLLDVSKINALGWHSKISLEDGIRQTYEHVLIHGGRNWI